MKILSTTRIAALDAYVPGEQPRDRKYIKLNTNESPFPPSPLVAQMMAGEEERLALYPDPTCAPLAAAAEEKYGIPREHFIFTNGSDEILNFALIAFCAGEREVAFPAITYGLYSVLCNMYGIKYEKIPLRDDFGINPRDYININKPIIIANPNAPTGLYLGTDEIEMIVSGNPDSAVIIDEAYIAFGGDSCLPLTAKYDNLLVTRTFSKSHSLAGARLGMGIGSPAVIAALNKIKYSFNAYSVNRLTLLAGTAALLDEEYYLEKCRAICRTRERVKTVLEEKGFFVTDSKANFLFTRSPDIGGEQLYLELKRRGILIRHFGTPAITDFNRITIGTDAEMDAFLTALGGILEKAGGNTSEKK